jgi:hypothetical protein
MPALVVAVCLAGCVGTPAPSGPPTAAPVTTPSPDSSATDSPEPTTAPAVTGTPADPEPYLTGDDQTLAFDSPSGNIQCVYQLYGDSEGWGCSLREQNVVLPPPDPASDCGGSATGFWVGVSTGSYVPEPSCFGIYETKPVLPYGSSMTYHDMACDSTEDGVRCVSLTSGNGFQLSRSDYELF